MKERSKKCKYIFVCLGKDCKKAGAKELGKQIQREIRKAGLKGQLRIIKTNCTGNCKKAPICIAGENCMTEVSPNDAQVLIEENYLA